MSNYTVKEVLYIIRHKSDLLDRASITGNFDLVDIVADADYIINHCGLTARQMQIFKMYYVHDFTLAMIGAELGTSHQAPSDALAQCKKKIEKFLKEEINID